MVSEQLNNGAYRIVRDDGLVIAEVAGKNQWAPASDGNLVAWASFKDPQYVISSRTVDGSTLGPIIQQSTNTQEDALQPFLANGWLFWSQLRNQMTTYAKNLLTGQIVGPFMSQKACGGAWSWAATSTRALAANQLHFGKNYQALMITAIMFDFTAGQFMTFNPATTPDILMLAQQVYAGGLIVRNSDSGAPWANNQGDAVKVAVEPRGNDFAVQFFINQHKFNEAQAASWELWERIVHPDGTMEPGTMVQQVVVQFDANGQATTPVPQWL